MLGPEEKTPKSLEAIAYLPPQLRPALMSEADQRALLWLGTTVDQAEGLVVFEAVLKVVNGATWIKMGPEQSQQLATTLSRFGFALAPDPCCSLFRSEPHDRLVLFRLPEPNESVVTASNPYRKALLFATLGLMSMSPPEPDFAKKADQLGEFVDHLPGLNEAERVCLAANHLWNQRNLDRVEQLRLQVLSVDQEQRLRLAQMATGFVVEDELGNAEFGLIAGRIYATLGLEPSHLPQEQTGDDRARESERERSHLPKLSSLLSETAQVEMGSSENDRPTELEAAKRDTSHLEENVDISSAIKQHRLVFALKTRRTWPRVEFDALVESFGLKPAEAIESLNEWALNRYGAPLIKGEDPIQIMPKTETEYLEAV